MPRSDRDDTTPVSVGQHERNARVLDLVRSRCFPDHPSKAHGPVWCHRSEIRLCCGMAEGFGARLIRLLGDPPFGLTVGALLTCAPSVPAPSRCWIICVNSCANSLRPLVPGSILNGAEHYVVLQSKGVDLDSTNGAISTGTSMNTVKGFDYSPPFQFI